jgi:glycosyltransferase involved in cell wall biosynthesis
MRPEDSSRSDCGGWEKQAHQVRAAFAHGSHVIRVGFTFSFVDDGWLGGLNYLRSLFSAILALPERQIDPVILMANDQGRALLDDFPPLTIVRNSIFGARSKWAHLQWAAYRCFERDLVLDAILKWYGISVLSHSYRIGFGAGVPAIAWIPDFQHVHLPEFFSPEEIDARDKHNAALVGAADRVLLSSRCAQKDFQGLYPKLGYKSRVLPFVADVPEDSAVPDRAVLGQRYGLSGPYFLVANQFWAHKNHKLIIDALHILKSQGMAVRVLATGKSFDHRWPGFFDELMGYAGALGVLDCFRVLGVVPRNDLIGLMKNAAAILSPSRFEGWATSIEEAKTLGVRVIASDIPVHREQAPPGGLYVDPDEPEDLAAAVQKVLTGHGRLPPTVMAQSLIERRQAFAIAYQEVVLELCGSGNDGATVRANAKWRDVSKRSCGDRGAA